MKYAVQVTGEERYFFDVVKRRYEPQFVTRVKYAKQFKSYKDAEDAKMRISLLDESLALSVIEVREEKKCDYNCFACPYADCINSHGSTKRERKIIEKVLGNR